MDLFNNPESTERVFLLSSKAGGCGINLIGANRLILFDPGQPALSRQLPLLILHRLESRFRPAGIGSCLERRPKERLCGSESRRVEHSESIPGFVYRFLTTGTVEEKIFQRQAHKQALSASVVDAKQGEARHFSVGDLKKLFLYNDATDCETHDTFKCKRCRDGKQFVKAPAMLYGDTSSLVIIFLMVEMAEIL